MNYCWLFHPNYIHFNKRSPESALQELELLAKAINLKVVFSGIVRISSIKASSFFGTGKVLEISNSLKLENVKDCVIVINDRLTPIQQRNLEKKWNVKVLDRTALILEIFGSRAVTKEGTLQVELAHITWQKSRLVRSWTHLERQRGGKGFLGGPGELQIELDKRYLTNRIKKINSDLNKIKKTRKLQRNRRKNQFPLVSLIGYTNSGKSTLFNRLTGANELAKNMLFATLDPKHRKVTFSYQKQFILSDTVGFVNNLPTELIRAFKATLDEVIYSDLILHVRDISHEDYISQNDDVLNIINTIFIESERDFSENVIEVINKIDKIKYSHNSIKNSLKRVHVSAKTGQGINDLIGVITKSL